MQFLVKLVFVYKYASAVYFAEGSVMLIYKYLRFRQTITIVVITTNAPFGLSGSRWGEDREWVQKPKAELSGAPGGLFDLIIQMRHREEMNLKSLPV